MDKQSIYKSTSSNRSIREQLFDQMLIISLCVSIVNIVGNIIISFPLDANIKWVFLIALTLIVNRFKKDSVWVRYFFITFIILVLVPLGWYNSGANNNNVIAYIFIITVAVCFLFEGLFRFSLVLMLVTDFLFFLYLEFFFSDLLIVHDPKTELFDRLVQIPLIILVTYFMLRQFSNTFYQRNQMLNELNKQLEKIAYQDELTMVNNRSFIFERYEETLQRQKPFISLMIDMDNFKQINDVYGHLTGDELLRELGVLLNSHFNNHGYIARYGGDEFILLLYIDYETIDFKLRSFLDHFASLNVVKQTNATISGGYAHYKAPQTLDEHLRLVDVTLYKAKNSGKNKILKA